VACHDVVTKVFQLVANIDYIGLLTFLTKQLHFVGVPDLIKIGPIELVIFRWSSQGLSQAGMGQGLLDPMLNLFYKLIHVV
jgi:hypothetical protein